MFQGTVNQTNCQKCPTRFFTNRFGSKTCKPCPDGSIAPKFGSERCSKCEPGYIALDKRECVSCGRGEHSLKGENSQGALRCVKCDFGTANNEVAKADSCDPCKPGSYSNKQGALECITCQEGTMLINRKTPCVFCPPGEHL